MKRPTHVTLDDLKRMSEVVSIRRLALAAGMNVSTLHARLQRGAPEITETESDRIKQVLRAAGLDTAEK